MHDYRRSKCHAYVDDSGSWNFRLNFIRDDWEDYDDFSSETTEPEPVTVVSDPNGHLLGEC